MKNYFIVFTIYLIIKVAVITNRANAENVYFSCNSEVEYQLVNTYSNPLFRCGDSPSFKRV